MEDLFDTLIEEWAPKPSSDPVWATVCLLLGSALLLGTGVFVLASALGGTL